MKEDATEKKKRRTSVTGILGIRTMKKGSFLGEEPLGIPSE